MAQEVRPEEVDIVPRLCLQLSDYKGLSSFWRVG